MKTTNAFLCFAIGAVCAFNVNAQRQAVTLNDGWQFTKGAADAPEARWQSVRVPHDWAIYGPFDRANDLQVVAVEQNGEKHETAHTGRTGGLPFIGKGSYRTTFQVADTAGRSHTLIFDGAMSHARVNVNGKEVAYWPYGYNSFYTVIDDAVVPGENTLEVGLENFERASRWYPGAGLYRNVHLVSTDKVHIPTWGTYVTTPKVSDEYASIRLESKIVGLKRGQKAQVTTTVFDRTGKEVARNSVPLENHGQPLVQSMLVESPELWSPSSPALYTARTVVSVDGKEVDSYDTRFGIRSIEFIPEKGFFLNGEPMKFQGVCNHHDLGPLGAAINESALRYRLELLKDMGVNAIRTSHNMPSPELVSLCDEMGLMLMVEPFDDWGFRPKSPNGYGAYFNDWAQRDITNMVEHYRNSPSVVLWSIGNEVTSQWSPDGIQELLMLQNLVHSLDPTRPVTCGMDQMCSFGNGFAATLDLPGFNYKPMYYDDAYNTLPQKLVLGTETASTVSSRGVYHFPVEFRGKQRVLHPDHQSSSYDNEDCPWSNIPDYDFAMDDDREWMVGQFVWTGFDYLGEPTPYDTDAWPNHSSLFGIIDLASLPKDRFYLYRSKWNKDDNTLHVLPHWNWKGREGQVTPVFVYTNYPKAELFINGKSQGMREKNDSTPMNRYRLMWNETVYQPGELKVVAYDADGNQAAEKVVRTAGKPSKLVVKANRSELKANGDDLVYFTVTLEDKNGNPVPVDDRMVSFEVDGAGTFEATANGDATCVLPFQEPQMKLFSGAATAIARSGKTPGDLTIKVTAKGVAPATATVQVR